MLKTKCPPEASARNTRADEPAKVLDIVKRERAIGEIEGFLGQFKAFQIGPEIVHARIGRLRSRPRQHVLGQIDAKHAGRALDHRPSGEPAEAAAKIDDAFPAQLGQQRSAWPAIPGPRPIPRTDRSIRL